MANHPADVPVRVRVLSVQVVEPVRHHLLRAEHRTRLLVDVSAGESEILVDQGQTRRYRRLPAVRLHVEQRERREISRECPTGRYWPKKKKISEKNRIIYLRAPNTRYHTVIMACVYSDVFFF